MDWLTGTLRVEGLFQSHRNIGGKTELNAIAQASGLCDTGPNGVATIGAIGSPPSPPTTC
jgi:hypothetical protein